MGFHLSEPDTKSNPMKAAVVATVQQMMYNWESRDLWSEMNSDSFFSAVLLRSLHPSAPLRHDLLQEKTQRFLRQQSLSPATSSSDKNPLFTFAATYLKTIQDSRIVFVSIYVRAIRALPGPVLRTANMYFQHTATGNPKRHLAVSTANDICSNCFPVNASATTVPCKSPCTSLLRPAVTTTVTKVLGACKCTRPQGCPFRKTLPLQG